MNKVFIFDIDGTLLPHGKKECTFLTSYAISELKKKNTVYIATGKSLDACKKISEALDINNIISSNGQVVSINNKIIYENYFKPEQIEYVEKILSSKNISYGIQGNYNKEIILNNDSEVLIKYLESVGINVENHEIKEKYSGNFEVVQMWYTSNLNIDFGEEFNKLKWPINGYDIVLNDSCKSKHFKQLFEEFYIYSFGDGENDIGMFGKSNVSIAMLNSNDKVKEYASCVCDDEYNNGIYKYLVKNLLIKPKLNNSICFFDIDGTLLKHKSKNIDKIDVSSIRQYISSGGTAVIATGRNYSQAIDLALQIDVNNLICSNGSDIYLNGINIYRKYLDHSQVLNIIDILTNLQIHYAIEDINNIYVTQCNDVDLIKQKIHNQGVLNVDVRENANYNEVFQVWALGTKYEIDKFMLLDINGVKKIRWSDEAVEITNSNINKSTAIKKLLNGIDFECMTFSFGDGENDIEMFENTDLSIVMGNAKEHIKNNGDYITKSVENNGVSYAMKKFGLI